MPHRLVRSRCVPSLLVLLPLALAGPTMGQDTSAQCTVSFDAVWSAKTHPTEFPPDPHFSPLIGGTHGDGVVFWAPGALASPGIEQVAETGATTIFRNEVMAAIGAGTAGTVVQGGSIPLSPGGAMASFGIDLDHPDLTLVTMIAPSPDWFVGVHGLPLLDGGVWVNGLVVDLPPYDAGTDSGISFTSGNAPTVPPEPIAQITGHPFVGGTSLGTFTVACTSDLRFYDGVEDGTVDAWTTVVSP